LFILLCITPTVRKLGLVPFTSLVGWKGHTKLVVEWNFLQQQQQQQQQVYKGQLYGHTGWSSTGTCHTCL
jgi:hypothetical protein